MGLVELSQILDEFDFFGGSTLSVGSFFIIGSMIIWINGLTHIKEKDPFLWSKFDISGIPKFTLRAIFDTGATICCVDQNVVPKETLEENTFIVHFSGIKWVLVSLNKEQVWREFRNIHGRSSSDA